MRELGVARERGKRVAVLIIRGAGLLPRALEGDY
jgi:hypothetical protein